MQRNIVGFHQDEAGVWAADLVCGHTQHVRHDPPLQNRDWVTSAEGRQAKIGAALDCLYCDMAALPTGLRVYQRSESFTESTVPEALLADHRTKKGVWAHVVVEAGKLEYVCAQGVFVLRPGVLGVVEPEVAHHVRPLGAVRFHLVFLRQPSAAP